MSIKSDLFNAAGDLVSGVLNRMAFNNTENEGRYLRKGRTNDRVFDQVSAELGPLTKYQRSLLREMVQDARLERNRETVRYQRAREAAQGPVRDTEGQSISPTFQARIVIKELDQYGNTRTYLLDIGGLSQPSDGEIMSRARKAGAETADGPVDKESERLRIPNGSTPPGDDSQWGIATMHVLNVRPE